MLGDAFEKAGINAKDFKESAKKQQKTIKKPAQNTKVKKSDSLKVDLPSSGTIKLKVTALSPLHLGSGKVYEPMHFIIDENILYEFELEDILPNLHEQKRVALMGLLRNQNENSFATINKFIKENAKEIAKQHAHTKIKVSKAIQKAYNQKVGEVAQVEGKGKNSKNVFNKFEIQKIQRKQAKSKDGVYNYIGYIPGSSFKGAVSTAFREFVYKSEGQKQMQEKFENTNTITEHIFKNFKVADATPTNISTSIGYAINKERFEEDKQSQINTLIEVIEPNSEFIVEINYDEMLKGKKAFNVADIFESCNIHYKQILDSVVDEDEICEYLEDSFYENSKALQLKPNQFLLRVGKHSGARAVTVEGLRKIAVKLCDIQNNDRDRDEKNMSNDEKSEKRVTRLHKKSRFENTDDIMRLMVDEGVIVDDKEKKMYKLSKDFLNNPQKIEDKVRNNRKTTIQAVLTQETTTWLYGNHPKDNKGLLPFGWILCEIVEQ